MAFEAVNAMSVQELNDAVRSGSDVVADLFATCKLSGAQLTGFLRERIASTSTHRGSATTGITPALANVDVWAEQSEKVGDDSDLVVTVDFIARRGADGLLGVDVMDDPNLNIYNVIVTIVPGSIAEKDGFFRLGDVITSIDGQSLAAPDGQSEPRQVYELVTDGKPSYAIEVIRGGRASASVREEGHAESSHAPKKFKLTLPSPEGAAAPAAPAGRERRQTVSIQFHGNFSDNLTAQTPRTKIFEHAAQLQRKHERVARARKSISAKRDAEEAAHKFGGHRTQSEQALSI
jgi:hypothetical protein